MDEDDAKTCQPPQYEVTDLDPYDRSESNTFTFLSPSNLCWEVKAKVIHALSSPLSFFHEVTVVGKESVNTTRSV